jgi:hypothetical protein
MLNSNVRANDEGLPTTNDDAKLIAMGAQLDAAWTHQNSINDSPHLDTDILPFEVLDHAVYAVAVIANEIRKQPATTLAGLKVKARAVAYEFSSYIESLDEIATAEYGGRFDSEEIMAASLALDVLSMDAENDAPLPSHTPEKLAECARFREAAE